MSDEKLDAIGQILADDNGELPVRIVIGQRGWVWVGRYAATADEVTLTGAKCIRRWGTTRGLAELCTTGPLTETKLDDGGTVRMHPLSVVGTLDCDAEKWRDALGG